MTKCALCNRKISDKHPSEVKLSLSNVKFINSHLDYFKLRSNLFVGGLLCSVKCRARILGAITKEKRRESKKQDNKKAITK